MLDSNMCKLWFLKEMKDLFIWLPNQNIISLCSRLFMDSPLDWHPQFAEEEGSKPKKSILLGQSLIFHQCRLKCLGVFVTQPASITLWWETPYGRGSLIQVRHHSSLTDSVRVIPVNPPASLHFQFTNEMPDQQEDHCWSLDNKVSIAEFLAYIWVSSC